MERNVSSVYAERLWNLGDERKTDLPVYGKRRSVLETAIQYHYEKACEIARNTVKAEAYRRKV